MSQREREALADYKRAAVDSERLIAMMALALQTAQFGLEILPKSDVRDAALSSVTIALDMEAKHWRANALVQHSLPDHQLADASHDAGHSPQP